MLKEFERMYFQPENQGWENPSPLTCTNEGKYKGIILGN